MGIPRAYVADMVLSTPQLMELSPDLMRKKFQALLDRWAGRACGKGGRYWLGWALVDRWAGRACGQRAHTTTHSPALVAL